MGQDAMCDTFGVVIYTVEKNSRHDPCKDVVMLQTEQDADGGK